MSQASGYAEDRAPQATVLITTKNRREDTLNAVRSAYAQTVPVEVLVIDDGSTDGTAEAVRQAFPQARVDRSEQSRGYIVQRNRGVAMASAPIVFSLDDDAVFSTPRVVEQTLTEFDHPRVGAVAIPHINVNVLPGQHPGYGIGESASAAGELRVVNSYIGCAHALRRDVFISLGGYRELLVHQGEEMDYCLRMLAAGYVTRLGRADPVHHFVSPKRDNRRMTVYGVRNALLYSWYNVPMPYLPLRLLGTTANLVKFHCFKRPHPIWLVKGLLQFPWTILRGQDRRAPVPCRVYRLARRLDRQGATPLHEVEALLPPLRHQPEPEQSHSRAAQQDSSPQ
ncbi:glycosyltransferase family 2 protein [Fontivita pretiosa]|uniref:glycosyltransferase family 2 protein n=1 Tax=Fontivita pretiosa TaxID=2989684 RepID=UPI003D162DE0